MLRWEHPNHHGGPCDNVPPLHMDDAIYKSRRKKQSSPLSKPLSPTLKAVQPVKKPTAKPQRQEKHSHHMTFENMVIVIRQEHFDRSIGEITFDESHAFDEGYQEYQTNLREKELSKVQYKGRNCTTNSPGAKDTSVPTLVNRFSKQKLKPEKAKQTYQRQGKPDTGPFQKFDDKPNGNRHACHNAGSGGLDPSLHCVEKRRNIVANESKKVKATTHEIESHDASEVSGECVSLSDLYTSWKSQTGSVASLQSHCTTTSRSTHPSPSSQHGGGCLSIGNNNGYSVSRSVEQEDTDYIFGPDTTTSSRSKITLEKEQDDFILNLVLQRSLEDYSSNSSVSGFSSQASSAQDSGMQSFDTGRMAVRLQSLRSNLAPRPFRSSSGCHLAMGGSTTGTGNPQTASQPFSILDAMDHDSDDEEDLPYTTHADIIWKRDVSTNRWRKKPVYVAPSEEETVLETVMQISARDALSSSMAELRLNSCRHW